MRIEEQWMLFRERDIAPNAPNVQLMEMRKAFYAGAGTGLNLSLRHPPGELLRELQAHIEAEDARRRAVGKNEGK